MGFFAIIFIITVSIIITRPLTAILHELGHAVPAILFTKQPAAIYIGYDESNKNSFQVKIGLLKIWLKYNPFLWYGGLCVHSTKNLSVNKNILILLAGPLASFCAAIIFFYSTIAYDLHGFLKLVFAAFMLSSTFDLYINLKPSNDPTVLQSGELVYNDGYQIKELLVNRRIEKHYEHALQSYHQEKFTEAGISAKRMLDKGWQEERIYRIALASSMQTKNYSQAKELFEIFLLRFEMGATDFNCLAFVCAQASEYNKALEYYSKSLELDPSDASSLNNKGYTLNLLERYEEAIPFFDKAIETDPAPAYAYNNRGLSKIKIGKVEEGLQDIQHSLQIDLGNAYAYRNLGIYHFDRGEYAKALDLFKQAKELDASTHIIDSLIDKALMHLPKEDVGR